MYQETKRILEVSLSTLTQTSSHYCIVSLLKNLATQLGEIPPHFKIIIPNNSQETGNPHCQIFGNRKVPKESSVIKSPNIQQEVCASILQYESRRTPLPEVSFTDSPAYLCRSKEIFQLLYFKMIHRLRNLRQ